MRSPGFDRPYPIAALNAALVDQHPQAEALSMHGTADQVSRHRADTCKNLDGALEHLVEPHSIQAVEADAAEAVEPEHCRQQG